MSPKNIATKPEIGYVSTLEMAGLGLEQANIYEVLIKNGPLPAGKIHQKTPFKRGLVYKILEQLEELGLVLKQDKPGKVAIFEPVHPLKLRELAENREQEAKNAQKALNGLLDNLILDYNTTLEKPGIKFYEGIPGIISVYQDILEGAREIRVFASNLDANNPELTRIIQEQAKKQARLGIKVRALASADSEEQHVIDRNKVSELGIEFRRVNQLRLPSQIIVYKDTVAISSLKNELITTVINNQAVAKSFEVIFELLWDFASPVHSSDPVTPQKTAPPTP